MDAVKAHTLSSRSNKLKGAQAVTNSFVTSFKARPFADQGSYDTKPPFPSSSTGYNRFWNTIHSLSSSHLIVQPKLRLGPVNDRHEQEAERVATQVVQGMGAPGAELGPRAPQIQRLAAAPSAGTAVSPQVEAGIAAARGGGQPLPADVRTSFEGLFRVNFGAVRIHTGRQAHVLTNAVEARAFTSGQDVFFDQGEYNPSISEGQHLIAHELVHVLQQTHQGGRAHPTAAGSIQRGKKKKKNKGHPGNQKGGGFIIEEETVGGKELQEQQKEAQAQREAAMPTAAKFIRSKQLSEWPSEQDKLPTIENISTGLGGIKYDGKFMSTYERRLYNDTGQSYTVLLGNAKVPVYPLVIIHLHFRGGEKRPYSSSIKRAYDELKDGVDRITLHDNNAIHKAIIDACLTKYTP